MLPAPSAMSQRFRTWGDALSGDLPTSKSVPDPGGPTRRSARTAPRATRGGPGGAGAWSQVTHPRTEAR